jgi:hypothetical protein
MPRQSMVTVFEVVEVFMGCSSILSSSPLHARDGPRICRNE